MRRLWIIFLLTLSGVAGNAFAQAPSVVPAAAPVDGGEQKKRLIEQKIKLLESLLNSPAAKSAAYGSDAETTTLVEHGQKVIAQARKAVIDGQYEAASKAVDEAMRTVSKATRNLQSGSAFAESAQRKTFEDQTEQVATYRKSIVDLTREPKLASAAQDLLARVDGLSAEAKQLATAGRLGEANKKLADAYKLATEDIARLRQGHEVVMSLKFDTPADEFAYEEKRYNSNQVMVDMLLAEGKGDGDRRKMIDQFVNEGGRLKREAEGLAEKGGHKDAVKTMERASGQLIRALQMMGVPVF